MAKKNPSFALPNVANRTLYTADNLPILRSMDSNCIDLIYLDPPFNTGRTWENPIEAGGKKAIASFEDTWRLADIHEDEKSELAVRYPRTASIIDSMQIINDDSWAAYLIYMGIRIAEMRRILKESGSIYFHCDPTMSHGVKLLMDSIFGKKNFRNEIVWGYRTQGVAMKWWPRKHDCIFMYVKSNSYTYHPTRERQIYQKAFRHTQIDAEGQHYVDSYLRDVWDHDATKPTISQSKERKGYPTQKPLALLERIIKASSNKGDVVLDPFCGCATTCVAAERLGRQWIGVDLSDKAAEIVVERLEEDVVVPLTDPESVVNHIEANRQDLLPKRTDLRKRTDDAEMRLRLYKQQGKKCKICEEEFKPQIMELDHIIAKAKGGQDVDENLQMLCRQCNSSKGSGGMTEAVRKYYERRAEEAKNKDTAAWKARRKKDLK